MSIEIEIDISELESYVEAVQKGIVGVDFILDQHLREGMESAVDIAKDICPVDTGALRESIHLEDREPLSYTLVADPRDKYGGGYAIYPEFGTSKQVAQPYAMPSILMVLPVIIERVKEELANILLGR